MIVISRAKLQNKCLNVREQVEVVEWNKKWSLSLLSCESSMSVKENPDRKKKFIKTFIEKSNDMDDVYENNEEYNRNK